MQAAQQAQAHSQRKADMKEAAAALGVQFSNPDNNKGPAAAARVSESAMGTAKPLPAVAAKGCAAGGGSGRLPEKRSAEEGGDTACARPAAASSTKGRAYHHHPRRRLALLEETRNTRGKVSLAASPVAMVMAKVSSMDGSHVRPLRAVGAFKL